MRRLTTLILAITAFFISCNRNPDLTEEEIYTILNEIITDDSVQFAQTLCATFEKPPLNNRAKKEFTSDDLIFIDRQISLFSKMTIKPNKIKRAGWKVLVKRNISPFTKSIPTRSDTIFHSYFSFPIISADRKKVILEIGSGGVFMGGANGTYLFQKINNKWVLKDSWNIIIV
ncbi:MAG: hypothetical protein H0W73_16335 [Bacteroidetes bacterium]|nr:hypothetical protein [Bacteroidota bacterium]